MSSDDTVMDWLQSQRRRIVARIAAAGNIGETLRAMLQVSTSAMEPFNQLGHWRDGGLEFSAFMWGLADDLGVPLAVLHRQGDGSYADPACVYSASPRQGFTYVAINELLQRYVDDSNVWPPRFALVKFRPGHYDSFVYAKRRPRRRS